MPKFTYKDEDHTYWLGDERLPSVTEIISPLVDYSKIPKGVLAHKCELGTQFHAAIKLYLNGELDEDSIDDRLIKPMEGFRKWVSKAIAPDECMAMETPTYHPTLKYAGTPDLSIDLLQKALYDWKLRPFNKIADPLQMAGYGGFGGNFNKDKWVISFDLEGNYKQHNAESKQAWPMFRKMLDRWKSEQEFKTLLEKWRENCK